MCTRRKNHEHKWEDSFRERMIQIIIISGWNLFSIQDELERMTMLAVQSIKREMRDLSTRSSAGTPIQHVPSHPHHYATNNNYPNMPQQQATDPHGYPHPQTIQHTNGQAQVSEMFQSQASYFHNFRKGKRQGGGSFSLGKELQLQDPQQSHPNYYW